MVGGSSSNGGATKVNGGWSMVLHDGDGGWTMIDDWRLIHHPMTIHT
jgi:hypothetical protein